MCSERKAPAATSSVVEEVAVAAGFNGQLQQQLI